MNYELLLVGIALVALGVMWYTERKRRREAELTLDVDRRREALDALKPKLDANKEAYDKAKADFDNSIIPAHMLDDVGKTLPPGTILKGTLVPDVRSGRLIDTGSGAIHDSGSEGKA